MLRRVSLQLDFFMCAQFAGVAVAHARGLYRAAGVELHLLPTCPPGHEPATVLKGVQAEGGVWAGVMEQSALIPEIQKGHDVKGMAAMFARSPLALAMKPGYRVPEGGEGMVIGGHVPPIVELIQRITPKSHVCCRFARLRARAFGCVRARAPG